MYKETNAKWDYYELIRRMKRWSFTSKMMKAFKASEKLVKPEAKDPSILRSMALPEVIETFTMLAIKHDEWQMQEMTDRDFSRAIDAIWSFKHPTLFRYEGEEFSKWFMMLCAANQFDFQASLIYRINRYISYFTYADEHIDMNTELKERFGLSYQEIAAPIISLYLSLTNEETKFTISQLKWLFTKYRATIDFLTLTREEYITELDAFATNFEDYIYCHRPSYSWPFILYEDQLLLPTPHLLIRAVTVSLMHRLTFQRNDLREKIGKYVLEPYLYNLVRASSEFQEVLREQEYDRGRERNQKTLDVLTAIDGNIVCFDSKSCTPLVGIRVFDTDALRKTIEVIAKSVSQAYKHIRFKFGDEYSFLSVQVKEDRSNIFAIVVLADNPYCPLEDIYSLAASRLGIHIPSEEYDWLRGHVGIANLDMIEIQVLSRDNFMNAVTRNLQSGRYSDNWFLQGGTNDNKLANKIMRQRIEDFIETVTDAMKADSILGKI